MGLFCGGQGNYETAQRTTHNALRTAPLAHHAAMRAPECHCSSGAGRIHAIASEPLAPPFKPHHALRTTHCALAHHAPRTTHHALRPWRTTHHAAMRAPECHCSSGAGRIHAIASEPLAPPFKPHNAPRTTHCALAHHAPRTTHHALRPWRTLHPFLDMRDCSTISEQHSEIVESWAMYIPCHLEFVVSRISARNRSLS